jgi:hypothetical protein
VGTASPRLRGVWLTDPAARGGVEVAAAPALGDPAPVLMGAGDSAGLLAR